MTQPHEFDAVPIELSAEHLGAIRRRRRIVDQLDANDVLRGLDCDLETWMAFVFAHADMAGSQVDSIWWDIGLAEDTYAIYDSQVLPRVHFPRLQRWWDQGIDWVGELVARARQRGLETFWSHRVCPVDFPQPWTDERIPHTDPRRRNPLKARHPDWTHPCWWWQGLWNLASAGLRRHKLAVLRELAERYALDGLQLDFARHVPCLPLDRQWELRDHATAFVRGLRLALLDVAKAKGHPILLAAKVPETLEGCRVDGFDVERWVGERLVDILVLGNRTTTVDLAAFRQIVAGTPVQLCPMLDDHHSTDGYHQPPIEFLRGVFGNWWHQGADSVGTFNWPCAPPAAYAALGLPADANPGPETQAVVEIGSAQTLRRKDATFAVERRGGYPWAEGCHSRNDHRPLPCPLANHGAPTTLPLFVYGGDAAHADEATLRLVLWSALLTDTLEVKLNGHPLQLVERDPEWKDRQVYSDKPQPSCPGRSWPPDDPRQKLLMERYLVEPGLLRVGENALELRVAARGPHKCGGRGTRIEVEKAELSLRY